MLFQSITRLLPEENQKVEDQIHRIRYTRHMIVVFGANGKTGIEVVKEAKRRGLEVRPIAKNDHDTHRLETVVDVNEIVFADADHPDAIISAIQGATCIVSCIDSRTAGFGAPEYSPEAGANIINVASQQNVQKMLHVSVMGGYRWSPNPLNRQTFHMDIRIRRLKVPWTMLRVSCYHDEIEDGHVRPPDGGKPRAFHPSSRYSPVSRADTGRVICNLLPDLIPNRTWLLGGPKVYVGKELEQVCKPFRTSGRSRSAYGGLPHGDFSVATATSEIMVGWVPTETLEWHLDPNNHPLPSRHNHPFWNRPDPEPHWSDQGDQCEVLTPLDAGLRFALHHQLLEALPYHIDLVVDHTIRLDFRHATFWNKIPAQNIYGISFQALNNVQVRVANGTVLTARVAFLYDELADDLQIWWHTAEDDSLEIPSYIWKELDLGIRRRLISNPLWQGCTLVRQYAAERHERVST